MKFTDGDWLLQPGVPGAPSGRGPRCAPPRADTLVIHAPTRPIRHRGDTLQGPLLTIRLSSPMPDVIRVRDRALHRRPPTAVRASRLEPAAGAAVEIERRRRTRRSCAAGSLAVRVPRGDTWELAFRGGDRVLTRSGRARHGLRAVAGAAAPSSTSSLRSASASASTAWASASPRSSRTARSVETWNKDGGTGSEQAYKNDPLLPDQPRLRRAGQRHRSRSRSRSPRSWSPACSSAVPGEQLEYFLIYGPTPKDSSAS